MKYLEIKTIITEYQIEELSEEDRQLIELAIEATNRSYAPYSHFCVGAAVLLNNGATLIGCNQENASYPVGLCAERTALFSAGVQYPDVPVKSMAIVARNTEGVLLDEPISPCGMCRQAVIETETRFKQPVRILLYGRKKIYAVDSIKTLMPLSFTDF
ncbi:MAG: cytidine deaminase [Prevotella sp.]|jgi:cytidine deaminase|nr:cytidine deaminase [Prevotella sp.]